MNLSHVTFQEIKGDAMTGNMHAVVFFQTSLVRVCVFQIEDFEGHGDFCVGISIKTLIGS